MKTIKKCWKVWDRLNSSGSDYGENYVEYIGADTRGEALSNFSDSKVDYIYRKAVRCPNNDRVEYEGKEMLRMDVDPLIKKNQRNKALTELPENDMYYVQTGIVGNDALFWELGGSGYTCNIERAQKYTKDEIVKQFTNGRPQDIIWPESHLNNIIKKVVDTQYLDYSKRV